MKASSTTCRTRFRRFCTPARCSSARRPSASSTPTSTVNVARKLDVDPELELRRASERFRARVEVAERLARENGEDGRSLPLERQDHYFDRAKETA